MVNEISVAIPAFNSTLTLGAVLEALSLQEIPALEVIIIDNGSTDGTLQMLEEQVKNKYWLWLHIRLSTFQHLAGDLKGNIPILRKKLVNECNTPLIFYLDSDVIIPPHSLQVIIKDFLALEKKNVGMLGMRYDPLNPHVHMGATLMRAELAKKIEWKFDDICECMNASKQLAEMGLEAKHHEWLTARHLKVNSM